MDIKKYIIIGGLAIAAVGATSALRIQGPDAPNPAAEATVQASRTKWEYKFVDAKDIKGDLDSGVTKLGEEGWELVSVNYGYEGIKKRQEFWFKRPI